jgi:hypothetical protein
LKGLGKEGRKKVIKEKNGIKKEDKLFRFFPRGCYMFKITYNKEILTQRNSSRIQSQTVYAPAQYANA